MTNELRGVTPGLPGTTAGSWKAKEQGSSDHISLSTQSTLVPEADRKQHVEARGRIAAIREHADRLHDMDTLVAIRDHVRSECGSDASYIGIVDVGDRTEEYVAVTAYTHTGKMIDIDLDAFENFKTETVDAYRTGTHPDSIRYYDTVIDIEALDTIDLDTEVAAVEQHFAESAANR
jgi:hypothetical protein